LKILNFKKIVLGLSVNERKAFQTKIVCLINLDKFDEALTSIDRFNDGNDFHFEKAYCAYRLNKTEDAYSILKQCNDMGVKEKELLAQVVIIRMTK
jgi:signal recognition particle subunit SRP72